MFDQSEAWAMNQQLSFNGCESLNRTVAERPTSGSGLWNVTPWRAALNALFGASIRLHRYRQLRTEVMEDALRAFGSGPKQGGRS